MTRSIIHESASVKIIFLLLFVFTAVGCQDHHWVDYDKMGPVAIQTKTESSKQEKIILSGKVELDPAEQIDSFKGFTLYVIVRSNGKNPILAAIKAVNVKFPYAFTITKKNVMFGEPDPKANYMVLARLDSDGNPDTKNKNDLSGDHNGDLSMGAENVSIMLARKKQ
ncbi:hypothetical protein MNBD_NITROSPINAE04-1642 [hydrothermal vent metagenome]|uniref:Lipoprotein n=1 Tax=hydrothermal vent metagenome TaxID=652676 RepID=A0A3B1CI18_9ZZZZ